MLTGFFPPPMIYATSEGKTSDTFCEGRFHSVLPARPGHGHWERPSFGEGQCLKCTCRTLFFLFSFGFPGKSVPLLGRASWFMCKQHCWYHSLNSGLSLKPSPLLWRVRKLSISLFQTGSSALGYLGGLFQILASEINSLRPSPTAFRAQLQVRIESREP